MKPYYRIKYQFVSGRKFYDEIKLDDSGNLKVKNIIILSNIMLDSNVGFDICKFETVETGTKGTTIYHGNDTNEFKNKLKKLLKDELS